MKVKDLSPAPYNPRKITDEKLKMLGKSMKEFGDLSGIVFNRQTGHIIGGHQRLKHLDPEWEIKDGFIKTPFGDFVYREVDWPEKKEKAANIAANKHSGEWDYPALKDLIIDIDDGTQDLELVGFDADELNNLFGENGNGKNDDGLIPPKDPNILVRLSFHPGLWLGKREEIKTILDRMTKTYDCQVKIEE